MIIQQNMLSLNASRQLGIINNNKCDSTTKLASGYKINKAADNAAGLSISEKMRAQIRGLDQSSRNLSDAISYVQVAEGALNEVSSIMQRIRELSVQAINDTNTEEDRTAIDKEVQQLKEEVKGIFKDTEFNTKKIWDTDPRYKVQIGTEEVKAVTGGSSYISGTLTEINKASIPKDGSFTLKANEDGIQVTWDAYNGKSYTSEVIGWADELKGTHSFKLSDYIDVAANPELQGVDFTYSYNVAEYAQLDDVIGSLDGAYISCPPYTNVSTQVYSKDGTPIDGINFSSSINYLALLKSDKDFDKYDTDFIVGSDSNLIQEPTKTDSSKQWKYEFQMSNIGTVTATSQSLYYYSNWRDPNQKWWHPHPTYGYDVINVFYPDGNDGSLDSVIDALVNNKGVNLVDDTETGGTIVMRFDITANSTYSYNGESSNNVGSVTMSINVSKTDTKDTILDKLANIGGIDIYAGRQDTGEGSISRYSGLAGVKTVMIDSPIYKFQNNMSIQAGANTNQRISMEYETLSLHVFGIKDSTLVTVTDADLCLLQIDNAIKMVSEQRTQFGAYQNRLEHAINLVNNTSENLSDAESKIRDTDMAKEMVKLSKENILAQATQSMFTNANSNMENVLLLLG